MRFAEIIEKEETYGAELKDEAINLLVAAQAQGVESIKPQQLTKSLSDLGYKVSLEALIDALQGHPLIQKITPQEIVVSTGDDYYVDADEKEKDDNKISKMAMNQVKKDIK